jgi:hypothetical protein
MFSTQWIQMVAEKPKTHQTSCNIVEYFRPKTLFIVVLETISNEDRCIMCNQQTNFTCYSGPNTLPSKENQR